MGRATRRSRDLVLAVQPRLTDRDRTLLGWLYDHQLLTTAQIAHALFPSLDFAQKRLLKLLDAALLDRFRPLRHGGGSYPWHYLLAQPGLELVAAARGDELPRRDAALARRRSLTRTRLLTHLLGVNQFFIDLAGHARLHPDTGGGLQRWLSARQCQTWGAFGPIAITRVRPDGHGVWREHGQTVPFYLEYDTGTETLDEIASVKIARYREHVQSSGPRWPVLVSLHSAVRERNLHRRLATGKLPLPVATYARDHAAAAGDSPADQAWLVHGADRVGRLRLAELAEFAEDPGPEELARHANRIVPRQPDPWAT
jgi:hypothetical protein